MVQPLACVVVCCSRVLMRFGNVRSSPSGYVVMLAGCGLLQLRVHLGCRRVRHILALPPSHPLVMSLLWDGARCVCMWHCELNKLR